MADQSDEAVTDLRYKKVQLQLKKLSPTDGDILVIALPPGTDAEQATEFAQGVKDHLPDGADIVIMITRDDTKIDLISEAQLNELGYFRNVH